MRNRSGSGWATWSIWSFLFKKWRDQSIFDCFWDVRKNEDDEDVGGTGTAESEGPLEGQAEGGLARVSSNARGREGTAAARFVGVVEGR